MSLAYVIFGVATPTDTFAMFTNPLIYLVIGGYLIAAAATISGLGRRIAFAFVLRFVSTCAQVAIISAFVLTFVLSFLIPHPWPRPSSLSRASWPSSPRPPICLTGMPRRHWPGRLRWVGPGFNHPADR